jgi:hypothetical protein
MIPCPQGRNPVEYTKMIAHIREQNKLQPSNPVRISVEVEKVKPELLDLLPLGDVV